MTKDDVLFGYRQALFAEAARASVAQACRRFGVHRSTYYAWKRAVDRHGLEVLRPRERRRPKMPSQLSKMVEERILSFSTAHPGLGPKRVSAELRRHKWGGIVVSPNGVWKVSAATASTRAPSAWGWWPATPLPTSRPETPAPNATSTSPGPVSWSGSTASTSVGRGAPRARSGSSPRSTSPPPSAGQSW